MPTSTRTSTSRGNKPASPENSARSPGPALGSGAPTRTQSLVARIFSNPLKKSGANRSSGSSPRDQSPTAPPHSQKLSPSQPRTSTEEPGRSSSRSPARSPTFRHPGRRSPKAAPAPHALYPPGGSRSPAEGSGQLQASSGEISFDSRGFPGSVPAPPLPNASGFSTMNENSDTISVPLRPPRTRPDDNPPPLDLFPEATHDTVNSVGGVAGTNRISKHLLDMKPVQAMNITGNEKKGHGSVSPAEIFHDPRTVSTAADPASVATTFNEEVDERSIIPVADSITLQQLSGALDDPPPSSPTFAPRDNTGHAVPTPIMHDSAGNASITPMNLPVAFTSGSTSLKRDANDEAMENSVELSWGLHSRARGGTGGGSPSGGRKSLERERENAGGPAEFYTTADSSAELTAAAEFRKKAGSSEPGQEMPVALPVPQGALPIVEDVHMHDSYIGSVASEEHTATQLPPAEAEVGSHSYRYTNEPEILPLAAPSVQRTPSNLRAPDRMPVEGARSKSSGREYSEYQEYNAVPEIVPADAVEEEEMAEEYLEAVPHARSLPSGPPVATLRQQDTRFRQIPSGPSGRFSIHEMIEDSTEMQVTGSPPSAPHTTAAQRAALGQLVPNSISSEVSERRAQAFSNMCDVMHPDGDDAMAHALEPVATGAHIPQQPSIDLNPDSTVVSATAAESASGTPVATADNGTPVASPAGTQDAAPVTASYSESTHADNPYVVIQKSGAPAQPSSARLFYQPPTSLNANAPPGSINSNAGAQAGMAAGAAMLSAQSGGASTSNTHSNTNAAPPTNSVVSSAAPSNSTPPSNPPTTTEDKRSASITLNPGNLTPETSNPPTAVPVATGTNTCTSTAAANTSTPLSTSPPAPGTPTSSQQRTRVSYTSSLYSQSFGKSQRSSTQRTSRGSESLSALPTPVGAALPAPSSVGFTYRKPYNHYSMMPVGVGLYSASNIGPHGTSLGNSSSGSSMWRASGRAPQSVGAVAMPLPPGSTEQNRHLQSGGGVRSTAYGGGAYGGGAYGQVVPPPLSGSSVRSPYSAYGASAPASTPNARISHSSYSTARYSTSSRYSTYGPAPTYSSAYSTTATAASRLSSSNGTLPADQYRPAFGAAARMRGLANNLEQPGSRDSSPVKREVITMRERMNAPRVPYATGPTPAQLETPRRMSTHSGALPRSPQGFHTSPTTASKGAGAVPATATPTTATTPSGQRSRSSMKSSPSAQEPVSAAAGTAEASTKVATAAAASVSPQPSGRVKSAMPAEAAMAVEAAFAVPGTALPRAPEPTLRSDAREREPPAATDVWGRLTSKQDASSSRGGGAAAGSSDSITMPRRSSTGTKTRAAGAAQGIAAATASTSASLRNEEISSSSVKAAAAGGSGSGTGGSVDWVIDDRPPTKGFQLAQPQQRMRSPFAAEPPQEGGTLSLVLMEIHGSWLMGASDRTAPLLVTQKSSINTTTSSAQPLAGH